MAVSKLWPVTVRLATVLDYASNPEKTTKSKSKYSDADYQALRDVVAYAKDGEKTERELFCEGIVQKVENGKVYTVEGNSSDSCRVNEYSIGYYEILGYGAPAY